MAATPIIAAAGAGRMGRGIAIVFAFAGHDVHLVDLKSRTPEEFSALKESALAEVGTTLTMLSQFGMLPAEAIEKAVARVHVFACNEAEAGLNTAGYIFEAVPETLAAKEDAFALICTHAAETAIIASTTSTILSTDLEQYVSHPERFLNAHWLNPAFLVPLVELSPASATAEGTTAALKTLLEQIGKVPVVCTASPGYIVPRIQALAMNEAARLVEEGVASAEDIDKATKYGFGFRFAILGLLEFIDWGGGDILFYASRYMREATGEDRFAAPQIVKDNMAEGRNGLRDKAGFLDYENMDIPDYQRARLEAFAAMLKHMDKLPKPGGAIQ
ncbi:MAG: 3-hydroxybutyryl-CoA dehydrogenase [Hyphomicrobiales bacterium]